MLCVAYDATTGAVSVVTPTPSDLNACQAVLSTYAETTAMPWSLTLADSLQIGGSIAVLWAFAWTFRMFIRVLSTDERKEGES